MAKPKAPTPQELYRRRRLLEEQERSAYLPPGLINHGNTCFMNSVLQGLIATQLLSDLVHFAPIPPTVQDRSVTRLAGQRSPQLTNGHNLSGPYEHPWLNTMPIGDVFLSIMYKAWDLQAKRKKEILSPRSLLGALGKKYDQYLDFAQQDAHEFLRILLDAMRMEELDIIKKRQPAALTPPKKRRKNTIVQSNPSTSSDPQEAPPPEIPEDERLMSFADLIFGGKLTSILVCQKCKNISQTYEDFNDISLSIKPEDYIHRKRDKLKNFAKRLTVFPTATISHAAPSHLNAPEIQRPSSVPPSPKERPNGQLVPRDEPPPSTGTRRRSLDIPSDINDSEKQLEDTDTTTDDTSKDRGSGGSSEPNGTAEGDDGHVLVNLSGPEGKNIEFVEVSSTPEKTEKKEKRKSQVEDNWAKLGRRLSLTVGLGKSKDRKSRPATLTSPPIIEGVASAETPAKRLSTDSATPRASLSSVGRAPSPDQRRTFLFPKLPTSDSPRPSLDARPSPSVSTTSLHPTPSNPRPKSPKPPKATAAEAEYLRKILADISTGPSNPLSTLFRPPSHANGGKNIGSGALSPHNVWLGMNQLTGIEECMRLFTAVEVLDGENMVGCRRCWKIANGVLPKSRSDGNIPLQNDDDSDSASNENSPPATQETSAELEQQQQQQPKPGRPPSIPHIQTSLHLPTSMSTPTVSFFSEAAEHEKSDTRSISSLPTEATSHHGSTSTDGSPSQSPHTSRTNSASSSSLESNTTPGGLPIPLISTTAPPEAPLDSESSSSTTRFASASDISDDGSISGVNVASQPVKGIVAPKPTRPNHLFSTPNNASKDSLPVPTLNVRRKHAVGVVGDSTTTDDDDESSADESDTSFATSVSADSVVSSLTRGSPPGLGVSATTVTPEDSAPSSSSAPAAQVSGAPATVGTPAKPPVKKPSKPKPVIMRPAYKRYLISTPPPVLVIHLKRFQQIAKSPFYSFSHGFKKLDDDISFPEHLDLTPFLAPRKEDYGLGKKSKKNKMEKAGKKKATEERCMYRLYAVVVHIGNMLGGHYVAYTALPTKSPIEGEGLAAKRAAPPSPPVPTPASAPPIPEAEGSPPAKEEASEVKTKNSTPAAAAAATATAAPALPASPPPSSSKGPSSTGTPKTTTMAAPPTTAAPSTPVPRTASSTTPSQQPRQWAYISDTIVRLTTLEEVLSAKAYICMYERC